MQPQLPVGERTGNPRREVIFKSSESLLKVRIEDLETESELLQKIKQQIINNECHIRNFVIESETEDLNWIKENSSWEHRDIRSLINIYDGGIGYLQVPSKRHLKGLQILSSAHDINNKLRKSLQSVGRGYASRMSISPCVTAVRLLQRFGKGVLARYLLRYLVPEIRLSSSFYTNTRSQIDSTDCRVSISVVGSGGSTRGNPTYCSLSTHTRPNWRSQSESSFLSGNSHARSSSLLNTFGNSNQSWIMSGRLSGRLSSFFSDNTSLDDWSMNTKSRASQWNISRHVSLSECIINECCYEKLQRIGRGYISRQSGVPLNLSVLATSSSSMGLPFWLPSQVLENSLMFMARLTESSFEKLQRIGKGYIRRKDILKPVMGGAQLSPKSGQRYCFPNVESVITPGVPLRDYYNNLQRYDSHLTGDSQPFEHHRMRGSTLRNSSQSAWSGANSSWMAQSGSSVNRGRWVTSFRESRKSSFISTSWLQMTDRSYGKIQRIGRGFLHRHYIARKTISPSLLNAAALLQRIGKGHLERMYFVKYQIEAKSLRIVSSSIGETQSVRHINKQLSDTDRSTLGSSQKYSFSLDDCAAFESSVLVSSSRAPSVPSNYSNYNHLKKSHDSRPFKLLQRIGRGYLLRKILLTPHRDSLHSAWSGANSSWMAQSGSSVNRGRWVTSFRESRKSCFISTSWLQMTDRSYGKIQRIGRGFLHRVYLTRYKCVKKTDLGHSLKHILTFTCPFNLTPKASLRLGNHQIQAIQKLQRIGRGHLGRNEVTDTGGSKASTMKSVRFASDSESQKWRLFDSNVSGSHTPNLIPSFPNSSIYDGSASRSSSKSVRFASDSKGSQPSNWSFCDAEVNAVQKMVYRFHGIGEHPDLALPYYSSDYESVRRETVSQTDFVSYITLSTVAAKLQTIIRKYLSTNVYYERLSKSKEYISKRIKYENNKNKDPAKVQHRFFRMIINTKYRKEYLIVKREKLTFVYKIQMYENKVNKYPVSVVVRSLFRNVLRKKLRIMAESVANADVIRRLGEDSFKPIEPSKTLEYVVLLQCAFRTTISKINFNFKKIKIRNLIREVTTTDNINDMIIHHREKGLIMQAAEAGRRVIEMRHITAAADKFIVGVSDFFEQLRSLENINFNQIIDKNNTSGTRVASNQHHSRNCLESDEQILRNFYQRESCFLFFEIRKEFILFLDNRLQVQLVEFLVLDENISRSHITVTESEEYLFIHKSYQEMTSAAFIQKVYRGVTERRQHVHRKFQKQEKDLLRKRFAEIESQLFSLQEDEFSDRNDIVKLHETLLVHIESQNPVFRLRQQQHQQDLLCDNPVVISERRSRRKQTCQMLLENVKFELFHSQLYRRISIMQSERTVRCSFANEEDLLWCGISVIPIQTLVRTYQSKRLFLTKQKLITASRLLEVWLLQASDISILWAAELHYITSLYSTICPQIVKREMVTIPKPSLQHTTQLLNELFFEEIPSLTHPVVSKICYAEERQRLQLQIQWITRRLIFKLLFNQIRNREELSKEEEIEWNKLRPYSRPQQSLQKMLTAITNIENWYKGLKQGTFGKRARLKSLRQSSASKYRSAVKREGVRVRIHLDKAIALDFQSGLQLLLSSFSKTETDARCDIEFSYLIEVNQITSSFSETQFSDRISLEEFLLMESSFNSSLKTVLETESHSRRTMTSNFSLDLLLLVDDSESAASTISVWFRLCARGVFNRTAKKNRIQNDVAQLRNKKTSNTYFNLVASIDDNYNEMAKLGVDTSNRRLRSEINIQPISISSFN